MNYTLLLSCSSPSIIPISQSKAGAYEAALAVTDSGLAVAWYDVRDGNAEIYLRRIGADGRLSGPERRLTDTPASSYEASIEQVGDVIAVAWYELEKDEAPTAMLGVWSRDGERMWVRPLAPASRNPVVRAAGRTILCAWIQAEADRSEWVWTGWWDPDGHPVRDPVRVGPASKDTWNLNAVAERSGEAWIVFDAAADTRASELFLARIDAQDVDLRRITRDDGIASKYPDVAVNESGRAALTWFDERDGNQEVYLLVADRDDLSGTIDDRARRVTTSPGESIGAYLAWNGERLGLAWSDEEGGQHEVYFQSFDIQGSPQSHPMRITRNYTSSLIPAIRPWQGGFALAWNEYAPASPVIHSGTSEVFFTLVP